jgi:hypothetical protein
MIDAPGEGSLLLAQTLARLCHRSQVRLLILHLRNPVSEKIGRYMVVADLARRIVDRGGPVVLSVPFGTAPSDAHGFLEEIYACIVHRALPLDVAIHGARQRWRSQSPDSSFPDRAILTLGRGGENLLQVSSLADNLISRSYEQQARALQLQERMSRLPVDPGLLAPLSGPHGPEPDRVGPHPTRPGPSLERAPNLIDAAITFARNTRNWADPTEGVGLIPLANALRMATDTEASLASAESLIAMAEESAARVINSSFVDQGRVVPQSETLGCGRPYLLRLQIGPALSTSHVRRPQEIPEQFLELFLDEPGIDLDVSVYSEHFSIPDGSKLRLRLPRRGPSQPLDVVLVAPPSPGQARLRTCVYYRQNLLQSLLVVAQVTSEPRTVTIDGNVADVDFSMADSLLGVEHLPRRTLNILTNERVDGQHTFVVRGPDFEQQYSFPGSPGIKIIRQKLLEICSELDSQGKPVKYKYSNDDNSGSKNKLEGDLKVLAPIGYILYVDLIINPINKDLEERLRSALSRPSLIQISVTSTERGIFPWALIYDKPFVSDPGNVACPRILQRIGTGTAVGDLRSNTCIDGLCPHAADTNVICPLGFWGFRHSIEQLPPNTGQIVTKIYVPGPLAFVMAVHRQLSGPAHRAEIEAESKIKANYYDLKKAIGQALSGTKPHFIYFFCHGGRTAGTPWLGVGNQEQIQPTDFHAWKARWPETHPIILINGCHTVDLSPDDLLNFVTVFSWCSAAGVIGTEIAIPESLAREFGRHFITRFANGKTVASIIAELRLSLLAKWNLLGLCYTPYCSGDLRLAQR